jgi:hypothetical protein
VIAARTVPQRRRVFPIPFQRTSDAEIREARDELHGRCFGTLFPLIVVPIDTEDVVTHARLDDSYEAMPLFQEWDDDLRISDNPFPRVAPLS